METPEGGAAAETTDAAAQDQGAGEKPSVNLENFGVAGTDKSAAELERHMAELEQERTTLRASTPAQLVKIRPEARQQLLGLVVMDDHDGGRVLRTSRMEHWRTEQIELQAGQSAHVVVLVGSTLTWFEQVEARLKSPPAEAAAPAAQPEV